MRRLKSVKAVFAIVVVSLVFSFALCSVHSDGMLGSDGKHRHIDFPCATDLNRYVAPEAWNPSHIRFTSVLTARPHVDEPHLPLLSSSIFKIPKSA
jgi:hypothetical protein